MSEAIDLEHLREWIGREQLAEDVVTPGLVDRFCATLGLAEPAEGLAPRLIHFCLCLDAVPTASLGLDGHPERGGFLPPVPLPRRMWASSTLAFDGDIAIGAPVRRKSTIADVTLKQGRGGALCFVDVDHRITADGRVAVTERQTLVYRAADRRDSTTNAPVAAGQGRARQRVEITPALLFRYSALTFNAHRIHYDLPYATREERYPALVVHGPLQASLLLHFAATCNGGRAPDRFSFRGQSPAFGDAPLDLHAGDIADDVLDLWSATPGGPVAMAAKAEWA